MVSAKRIRRREQVRPEDTWDLSSLFANEDQWEQSLRKLQRKLAGYKRFRGRLGESAATLAACLKFDIQVDRLGERVGTYAFLKAAEDQTNSAYQRMLGRYQSAATRAAEAASYIRPEILAIPADTMGKLLSAREMEPYRLLLQRLLRYRDHTLSEKEEQLLAMQGEMSQAANRAFRQLLDADMKFGTIKDGQDRSVELTHATFMELLHSPRAAVRKAAFHQYYEQFQSHQHTLAATLSGSVQKDVYYARVRGYESSLAAALYPDNVPPSVYDNLIARVRHRLPTLHRYYELRRRRMKLRQIHHYDTYAPILSDLDVRHSWRQAVATVLEALQPLGAHYVGALQQGLEGRWCDRYPNQGKQSGAFSCGSYDGDPYILMNFKPEVLDDVFTLAHEAGHSMHSYLSARHQPYQYHDYTIFVAEVASTFNEQLLTRHLVQRSQRRPAAGLSGQSGHRCDPGHDLPADDVRRIREDHARDGGSERAIDGGVAAGRLPRTAGDLLRAGFHARCPAEPGVPAHSPLLSCLLRVQIRHRHVGGHRLEPARAGRRATGSGRLHPLSPGRLFQGPLGPAA